MNLDLDLLDTGPRQILREQALAVLNASARFVAAAELDRFATCLTGEHDETVFKLLGLSDRTILAINKVIEETKKAITERTKQLREQA